MDAQTPRTDKAAHGFCQSNPQKTAMDMWDIECVDADFARELERELATANEKCENLHARMRETEAKLIAARNDALEDAAKLCDEASDLHANGEDWLSACEFCASDVRELKSK